MVRNHSSKPTNSNLEKWYYDACTLDHGRGVYGEMLSKHNPIRPVISHLSLGEAFGNSHHEGIDELDAFVGLIKSLEPYVEFIGNDGCGKELAAVQEQFPALSPTDSLHVATALHNKCVVIRTSDGDLCGIPKKKLNDIGQQFNLSHFSAVKM